jgi:hypothetical protein
MNKPFFLCENRGLFGDKDIHSHVVSIFDVRWNAIVCQIKSVIINNIAIILFVTPIIYIAIPFEM